MPSSAVAGGMFGIPVPHTAHVSITQCFFFLLKSLTDCFSEAFIVVAVTVGSYDYDFNYFLMRHNDCVGVGTGVPLAGSFMSQTDILIAESILSQLFAGILTLINVGHQKRQIVAGGRAQP